MVTSMAMPSATLKISTVEGFRRTPAQPIMPAVTTNGIKLGIREQINIRTDLNKYNIHKAINKNAHKRLCFKPFIIKVLPSKKVMVVPVNVTLNFEVSKSSLVRFLIPRRINGSLSVPTSAILMLIRVLSLAVSIKLESKLVRLFFVWTLSLAGFKYPSKKAASYESGIE